MATRPLPVARSHTHHSPAVGSAAGGDAAAARLKHNARISAAQLDGFSSPQQEKKAVAREKHLANVQGKRDKHQAALDAKRLKHNPPPATVPAAVVPPPATDTLAPQNYATGSSGGGAAGYGSGYQYAESDAATDGGSTGGDSTAQAAKKSSGLSTKTKIWIGVGVGGAIVLWVAYRYVTTPLRKYRRVKGLVQNLIEGGKNLVGEVKKG